MDDLMAYSEAELRTYNEAVNMYNNFPQRDGVLIPEDPYLPYAQGKTKHVDMMIGTNANEINYWVGELGGIVPFRFGIPVKLENDLKKMEPGGVNVVRKFLKGKKGHPIWKIAEFYKEDVKELDSRIRELKDAAREYTSFSGAASDMNSTVKFIIKADTIA
jgi:para-nitrobenzyl esterase